MKLLSLLMAAVLVAPMANLAAAHLPQRDEDEGQRTRQTVAAESNVIVMLCLESGDVVVRGSERREVSARSGDDQRIELRRTDETSAPNPATRIEVLLSEAEGGHRARSAACNPRGSVELNVPRGATVQLKTRSSEVDVADVAEAHVESQSGDVKVRGVSKVIEIGSISGSISLNNSTGRVRLHTISGDVSVTDVCTTGASDDLMVKTLSGDITLERVCHARVEGITTNGDVTLIGPLARGGRYDFRTTSGDVTLTMPADVSFQVDARVHAGGEIITNFPIKQISEGNVLNVLRSGRLVGVYGTNDAVRATLNLSAFNGTLHLRRK